MDDVLSLSLRHLKNTKKKKFILIKMQKISSPRPRAVQVFVLLQSQHAAGPPVLLACHLKFHITSELDPSQWCFFLVGLLGKAPGPSWSPRRTVSHRNRRITSVTRMRPAVPVMFPCRQEAHKVVPRAKWKRNIVTNKQAFQSHDPEPLSSRRALL